MPRAHAFPDWGQLFIVGFDGTEVTPRLRALLSSVQPSGVILFKRNIAGVEQTWRLLHDCQSCVDIRLFTCVDMEGGTVDRFRDLLGPSPSPADVFATGDLRAFRKHGQLIGELCHALGFNVDFAPVLDLAFDAARSVLTSRAVSRDPAEVASFARQFLGGLRDRGVIGSGKHFPGLGEANLDTHAELPRVSKKLSQMLRQDIQPYKLLRRDLPFVMIGHAAYPDVTGNELPASLSRKWITDILRRKIGYRGLIVTDDMEMGALLKTKPIDEAAVLALEAGVDQLLICHQEEAVLSAYEAVCRKADRDRRFARLAQESLARVASSKKRHLAHLRRPGKPPNQTRIEKLSRAIWEFSEQVRLEALACREGA